MSIDPRIETQRAEFDALVELWARYHQLPAIVDDDYPRARHHYEGAMNDFIRALVGNRRQQILEILRYTASTVDEIAPHDYVPSTMHMGDCAVCGHEQHAPIHGTRWR